MKRVFIFCATAFFTLSLGLSGCVQEDPAKPLEVDWNRTATIKGTFLIADEVSNTTYTTPYSPDFSNFSEAFLVKIPYRYLNSNLTGEYMLPKENIGYSVYDGTFTIKVPVGIKGAKIFVKVSDFEGILYDDTFGVEEDKAVIWKASDYTGVWTDKILPGEIYYLEPWVLNSGCAINKVVSDY